MQATHKCELAELANSLQRADEASKQQDLELKAKELAVEHGLEQSKLRESALQ